MLAIYTPDRKLAGTIGDATALQMTPGTCRGGQSIKLPADPVPNKNARPGSQPKGLRSL